MRHTPSSFLSLFALAACGGITDEQPDSAIGLSQFANCDAMESHLTESFLHTMTAYAYGAEVDIAFASGEDDGGGSTSSPSHSTTNVQERGVDEADLVKTDGDYVYALEGDTLSIVRSWPAESAELLSQIEIKPIGDDGYNSEQMFLSGDRILVYTSEWGNSKGGWTNKTGITIIDVSDRKTPKVTERKLIDGRLVSARMIGADVYTVLNNTINVPESVYSELAIKSMDWSIFDAAYNLPWDAPIISRLAARARLKSFLQPIVEASVREMGARSFLPSLTHEDGSTEQLLGCTDILHSKDVTEPGLTTVAHVNLDDDTIKVSADATGVMAGGTTVYASPENLYVAQSSYGWWDGITEMSRETRIHRLALDGANSRYEATGVVDGFMHNQFSMSEREGLLRVATTYEDWSWGTTTEDRRSGSNVFILDAEQAQMGVIGAVTGLAPGERIYATRFQGDRAYMVTFVQVDPLFTIDLSRPTEPKAVGELKIPGYSAYLHPIGKDHVLGVGMAGDWDGGLSGVAISLFDVTDFADPQQQDQLTLECEGSSSEALWDHHAILVYGDTVAIPTYGYSWSGMPSDEEDYRSTSGLLVATIDTDRGLSKRGFVSHRPLVEAIYCPEEGEDEDCTDTSFTPQLRRSLVIEDYLFSISDLGLMVSSMADPEVAVATVPFL